MKGLEILVAAFVLVLVSTGLATADDKADPRENPETAIVEGIRLLEAKDYALVLKNFATPDQLKKMTEKTTIEEAAKEFGKGHAPQLLQILKSIKDVKPTLDPDGKKATYELKKPIDGKKALIWLKIDKYWYIEN